VTKGRKPSGKPPTKVHSFRVKPDMWERLEETREDDEKYSDLIRKLLDQALKRRVL
jgi:predicted CopG family antitoxin